MDEDDDVLVLDRIPPPELHLLMGVVNHIIALMIKIWTDRILNWLRSKGIHRHGYNGGGLDGNNSKKLLACLDILERDGIAEVP